MKGDQIELLLKRILKIPGQKILTLFDGGRFFNIDVNSDGVFGYVEGLDALFKAKLCSAFLGSASLIIRQFLPITIERKINGRNIQMPLKNVYAAVIKDGTWRGLSKSEVREAHCIDADTGKPITPEKDVFFCDFPK